MLFRSQVFLSELAGLGEQLSRGLENLVWRWTSPLRERTPAPFASLAALLYTLSWPSNAGDGAEGQAIDLAPYQDLFAALPSYPGGAEISTSFTALATFQSAASLEDLAVAERELAGLPSAADAIRPEVITALERFAAIGRDVAVALAASSPVNQLAALARAGEALETLGTVIEQQALLPEQRLLRAVQQRWRSLVSQGAGRLGHQVERSRRRVVNPYVAGNPVKGALFVGRDEILRQLEELWLNPGQVDSLVLYGHRRMGKSSILKNLPRRLDPARNWIVDFNLQTVNRANTGSLLYDLALAMRDQLPPDQVQSHPAPSEDSCRDNFQRAFNQ